MPHNKEQPGQSQQDKNVNRPRHKEEREGSDLDERNNPQHQERDDDYMVEEESQKSNREQR